MLKHMLTQTSSHPRTPENRRVPSTATVVGIPSMEELASGGGSSSPTTMGGSPRPGSSSNRPISVHGNLIHNHSIYANTTAATNSKMITRLNQSANGNLNVSGGANFLQLNSSSNASPSTNGTKTTLMDSSRDQSHHDLNSTQISPIVGIRRNQVNRNPSKIYGQTNGDVRSHNTTNNTTLKSRLNSSQVSRFMLLSKEAGVKEMITSLALLCVISLLLALLSLVFLLAVSPSSSDSKDPPRKFDFLSETDHVVVYEVTLGMCALSLSLNLCCLLVCAIQFIFAIKLVRGRHGPSSTNKYLQEAALTRTCAIGGFFVSIPIFLTGIILYTYLHFDSTPAIFMSILIGLGIVFCGAAIVHNVFVWQKEKSKARRLDVGTTTSLTPALRKKDVFRKDGKSFVGLPQATLDLSGPNATVISAKGLELSTLV